MVIVVLCHCVTRLMIELIKSVMIVLLGTLVAFEEAR